MASVAFCMRRKKLGDRGEAVLCFDVAGNVVESFRDLCDGSGRSTPIPKSDGWRRLYQDVETLGRRKAARLNHV